MYAVIVIETRGARTGHRDIILLGPIDIPERELGEVYRQLYRFTYIITGIQFTGGKTDSVDRTNKGSKYCGGRDLLCRDDFA